MKKKTGVLTTALIVLFVLLGFGIIALIESELVATEIVIAMAFLTNLAIANCDTLKKLKVRLTNLNASFLFGALIGVVLL